MTRIVCLLVVWICGCSSSDHSAQPDGGAIPDGRATSDGPGDSAPDGPNPDAALPHAVSVSSGYYSLCALTDAGGVKCWGANPDGRLGDGTTNPSDTPVDVVGLGYGVTGLSVGMGHACAVVAGGVKCWGDNDSGQLGNNSQTESLVPVDVTGLGAGSHIVEVSAGEHFTCALSDAGGVKCWGQNGAGQLGDGVVDSMRLTPVDVVGLSTGVRRIAAGGEGTLAVVGDGVKAWGSIARDGNNKFDPSVAGDVVGLTSGVAAATVGNGHACVLRTNGGVRCWGYNGDGELGNGTSGAATSTTVPGDVSGLTSGVTTVSAGFDHTCAVVTGGGMKCWGFGTSTTPGDMTGLPSAVLSMSAKLTNECAVTSSGVYCRPDSLGNMTMLRVDGFGP